MRSPTLLVQPTSAPAGVSLGLMPSPAAPLPVPQTHPPLGWVTEVWRISAEKGANTLRLAKVLRAARKSLLRGQWAEHWRSGTMPFFKKKADMLVRIALLAGLNEQTFSHLPLGWSILYPLARLELDTLEALVREGIVHPKLTVTQAEALAL